MYSIATNLINHDIADYTNAKVLETNSPDQVCKSIHFSSPPVPHSTLIPPWTLEPVHATCNWLNCVVMPGMHDI